MKKALSTLIVLLFLPVCAQAQTIEPFEWYPDGTYDSSIPTPWDFLGYQIGDDYTWHHEMKAYLEAVAEASDRVTIRSFGKTYEGRDLLLLTISTPQNLARVEEIRRDMATLADPRGVQNSRLESIIENSPAVAWLTYNVHGSESAGTEAAILTVYQLAAGTDQVTRNILDELVVMVAPLLNPDGRDRVVASYKKRSGSRPDATPESWEHGSDWPGGRTNHFMFDLNRDWAWQTQIEIQAIVSEILQWNPVVHVDFHEMGGDSYFFFPAATPVHDAFPDVVMKWQEYYGEGNAAAFDHYGWPYYTKVGFDMYYPAFGDSWPSMMGSIGMTYEQGGGGGVAIALERDDGTVHTLRQRAHGHFTTSIATLRTTAEKRQERLQDFLAFFRHAISLGDAEVKSYAFVPAKDPYNADRLVDLLIRNGLEVSSATESFRARVAGGYGVYPEQSTIDFPAGTYLVEAGQPRGVAVQVLLEVQPTLEDTSFYDLSGWALPLVYNVEAYTLSEVPRIDRTPVTGLPSHSGGIEGGRAEYAWAIPYDGTSALLTALHLLNRDIRVNSAGESFTVGGREYPAGTFVIPLYRNPEDLQEIIAEIVAEHGVTAYPLNTGLVEEGTDLGAGLYRRLQKPRVAVLAGQSAGGSFGQSWHFFDQRYPWFDYTNIDASRLGRTDLSDYNVLILSGSLDEQETEAVRTWLQGGGVLLAWGGGARTASTMAGVTMAGGGGGRGGGQMGGGAPGGGAASGAGQRNSDADDDDDELAIDARKTLAERKQESKLRRTPGGMYGIVLDPDHWLAFGMPERMGILKRGGTSFDITERGVNVGVFMPEPLLCGYAGPDFAEGLSTQAWLIVGNVGRGKVVLFADDPLWRMFLEGEHQFVLNALILGPAF